MHRLHHLHDSQTKKGLNNVFSCYPPKIRTYSTTMIMVTFIIIDIAYHSSCYEDIFKNLFIHLGVHIIEYLSLHLQII